MFNEIPKYLVVGIAAAFRYDYMEDPDAKVIQEAIQQQGSRAIETFTGLKPGTMLFEAIVEQYGLVEVSKSRKIFLPAFWVRTLFSLSKTLLGFAFMLSSSSETL